MNPLTTESILHSFPLIIPEALLCLVACVLFLGGTFRPGRHLWGSVAFLALVVAQIVVSTTPPRAFASSEAARSALFSAPIWLDSYGVLIKTLALVGGMILVLLSWNEIDDHHAPEYHGCLLTIIAGLCFTAGANDLVTLFLALELISIPTYVLLYLPRVEATAQEAALKYFLLSIFSSALLLFGFSYLYGLSGTTNLHGIIDAVAGQDLLEARVVPGTLIVAVFMVVAGLGFKITAVPFHYYAADVYQGTTTPCAALLAYVPKVAGFVALVRVLGFLPYNLGAERGFGPMATSQVSMLLWILAAVTMTTGNILALWQTNLKRLLAYSSVAHAGYMLIGLAVAPHINFRTGPTALIRAGSVDAILFYLAAYGAMTIGAFAVLACLSSRERPVEEIKDLEGLSRSNPGIALLLALFLFSLLGMPLTAGFWGKALLFLSAFMVESDPTALDGGSVARWFRILAIIGAINAAIAGYYYLRVIAAMYLLEPRPGEKPLPRPKLSPALVAVFACAAITLLLGVIPSLLSNRAQKAAEGKVPVATLPVEQQQAER